MEADQPLSATSHEGEILGTYARRKQWVQSHPAPRYAVSGFLTFCVDIGALKTFHGIAHIALIPATILAFTCAFAVNFTLSRNWTFATGRGGVTHRQLVRFLILVAINLTTTVAIVSGLSHFGLNYLVAKVIATVCNAVGNFFAYRRWVFA